MLQLTVPVEDPKNGSEDLRSDYSCKMLPSSPALALLPARPPSPFTAGLPQLLPREAAQRLSLCPIQRRITQRAAAAAISSSLARSERKERACVLLGYLYLWLRSRRKRHSPRLAMHPDEARLRCSRGSCSAWPGFALGSRSGAGLSRVN